MALKQQLINCQHCGNKAPSWVIYTGICVDSDDEERAGQNAFRVKYWLTKCSTCTDISLYATNSEYGSLEEFDLAELCYPHKQIFGSGVPKSVLQEYDEAAKVEKISTNAYAVMLRRALEAVCKDKKAKGKSLHNMLLDLADKKIIPDKLAEISQTLRTLGNTGAHHGDTEIDKHEVRIMKEFFISMIEYVYVAPRKLERLKRSIARKTAEAK